MQSQESMFDKSEPSRVQPINTDPREQQQRQEVPPAEGNGEAYKEYSEGYGSKERSSEEVPTEPAYGEPQWQREGEKIRPQARVKRRGGAKPLVIFLLIVALVIGWGGFSSSGRFIGSERALSAQTFVVTTAPKLVINSGSGDVRIHAGDVGSVVVSARVHEWGFGTSDEKNVKVNAQMQDNTVTVNPNASPSGMFMGSERVDLDITVPNATNMEIRTGSGDIDIEGVNGQIALTTGSGDIKGNNLTGAFTVKTGSGDIDLREALLQGQTSFRSGSGHIDVRGGLDPQGDYQFQTGSGEVKLTLPQDTAFRLNTHTSGDVENKFESPHDSTAPGPPVRIESGSGDITVQPQDD